MSSSLKLRLSRFLARHCYRDILPLCGKQGIISITFDDVAASTCDIAGALLDKYQSKATFYVAGGLTDHNEEGIRCHSKAQLLQLIERGHEIGGHSFNHVHYDQLSASQIRQQIRQEKAFLADCGTDISTANFAYPFGAYSLTAKRLLRRHFTSCRITGGKTQLHKADLQLLKTYRLYHDSDTRDIHAQIALAAQHTGWLILNTHDISDHPSAYGYTAKGLEEVIQSSLASGCKIMSVKDAITYWKQCASAS